MRRTILSVFLVAALGAPAYAGLGDDFHYSNPIGQFHGSAGGGGGGGGRSDRPSHDDDVDRSTETRHSEPARPGGWSRNAPDEVSRADEQNRKGYHLLEKGTEIFVGGNHKRAIGYFEDAVRCIEEASRVLQDGRQEKLLADAREGLAIVETTWARDLVAKNKVDEALAFAERAMRHSPGQAFRDNYNAIKAESDRRWCILHIPLQAPPPSGDNDWMRERIEANRTQRMPEGRAHGCEWAR